MQCVKPPASSAGANARSRFRSKRPSRASRPRLQMTIAMSRSIMGSGAEQSIYARISAAEYAIGFDPRDGVSRVVIHRMHLSDNKTMVGHEVDGIANPPNS